MEVRFYNITKKVNSTKQPSDSELIKSVNNVVLKSPTTITNPSIQTTYDFNLIVANYCFIPSFSRYYFIEDIELTTASIMTITLTVDVLASFKSPIISSTQYIVRSSIKRTIDLIDNMYPQKVGQLRKTVTQSFLEPGSKMYILGVIGQSMASNTLTVGCIQYVLIDTANMTNLMNFLFNPENFTDIIVDNVVKAFFNPFQYVASCLFIPTTNQQYTEAVPLKLGWYTPTDVNCYPITQPFFEPPNASSFTLAIPRPYTDKEDFRNYSPFASYKLYVPNMGVVEIDGSLLKSDDNLHFVQRMDVSTGEMTLVITGNESNNFITLLTYPFGTQLALSQVAMATDAISAIGGAIGAGVSGIGDFIEWANSGPDGTDRGRQAAKIYKQVSSGVSSITGQVSSTGSNGNTSIQYVKGNIELYCDYLESAEISNEDFGSPFCESDLVSNHANGYIVCQDPHIAGVNILAKEQESIESYMSGGMFIE